MRTVRLRMSAPELRDGDLVLVEGRYRPWWATYGIDRPAHEQTVMTATGSPPDLDFRATNGKALLVRRAVAPNRCPRCGRDLGDKESAALEQPHTEEGKR